METSGGDGVVIRKDRERKKPSFDGGGSLCFLWNLPGQIRWFRGQLLLVIRTDYGHDTVNCPATHQVHLGYRHNFDRPISGLSTARPLLLHTCANVFQTVNTIKLFHWRLGELFSDRCVLRGPVSRYNCWREYFEQTLILMDNVIPTAINHSRTTEGLRTYKPRTCGNVNSGFLGPENQQVQTETWRWFESLHS